MKFSYDELIKVNHEWLIYWRKKRGYTQKDVATHLQKNQLRIIEWEKTGLLTYEEISDLAELYNVSSLAFFNNESPPPLNIEQIWKDYKIELSIDMTIKK